MKIRLKVRTAYVTSSRAYGCMAGSARPTASAHLVNEEDAWHELRYALVDITVDHLQPSEGIRLPSACG